VVFDGDTDRKGKGEPEANQRDNGCILRLCGSDEDALSNTIIWGDNIVMWPTRIADVVRDELGSAQWDASEAQAKERHGFSTDVKRKNGMVVAAIVEQLWDDGLKSENLAQVCDRILAFAQKHQPLLLP